jgi:osmotically-inducible protein OsmY
MSPLEETIMGALADNPHVAADEIAVQEVDGDVILEGTVGSLTQRVEAVRTARAVRGVANVEDRLRVRVLDADRRADADTEAAVRDALHAERSLGSDGVDVVVRDGKVTLSGLVDVPSQRDRAERVVLAVPGVAAVDNRLTAVLNVSADEVAERVTDAVGADEITVTVRDEVVTLTGSVRVSADRDRAIIAAAGTPGVADVDDRIRVLL